MTSQATPENKAAWIPSKTAYPLQIEPSPFPTNLAPNHLIIRNRALAINPVDWFIQKPGNPLFNYLPYPFILGSDISGIVHSSNSPLFKEGDRVVSHALGSDHRSKNPTEGAFQQYVLARDYLTAKIPDLVDFKDAAVLPLGLTTAATALFLPKFLGLDYPRLGAEEKQGKGVLVWGASTSVGSNAVQLARGAGYEVVATAGEKNWGYVKGKLGAKEVWDYKSETVVKDVVKWFSEQEKVCVGAVAIGDGSVDKCLDILGEVKGVEGKRKFVAQVSGSVSVEEAANFKGILGLLGILGEMIWAGVRWTVKSRLKGVKYEFVWGSDLVDGEDGLCGKVWNEYLPGALAEGSFVVAPEALVAGEGLEKVQEAFEVCKKGVSAKKVVVTL